MRVFSAQRLCFYFTIGEAVRQCFFRYDAGNCFPRLRFFSFCDTLLPNVISEIIFVKAINKETLKKELIRYTVMVIACAVFAFGVDVFLAANNIVSGGTSGLATLIYLLTDFNIGICSILLNIPILLLGLKQMGWRFIVRCLITVVVLGVALDLCKMIRPLTDNRILASVYGGILQGIGVGLFIKFKVSSGGTELLGRVIQNFVKFLNIPTCIAILDTIIVVSGSIALRDAENLFYALMVIFVSAKISDLVVVGVNKSKLCYIITEKGDVISDFLIKASRRGITMLEGKGMYTKNEKQILMTCVKPAQIEFLRSTVKQFDPNAFFIVSDAVDVFGKGFGPLDDKY